jgi:hypothetical protein
MDNKITYYFGAGASANSLPTINGIPGRISEILGILRDTLESNEGFSKEEGYFIPELKKEIINYLETLLKNIGNAQTVDTYAKKLHLQGNPQELIEFKKRLILYFLIEQILNPIDPRYDTFFASIFEEKLEIPPQIKVVSWNYDLQFELAFSSYSNDYSLDSVLASLGVVAKNFRVSKGEGETGQTSVFKLNSLASFSNTNTYVFDFNQGAILGNERSDIIKLYSFLKKGLDSGIINPTLSYAWEKDTFRSSQRSIEDITIENISDTKTLVVIGYTFPFFNRKADGKILGSLKNLDKVYVQDLNPDDVIETLKSIFKPTHGHLFKHDFFEPIRNTKSFFIPRSL